MVVNFLSPCSGEYQLIIRNLCVNTSKVIQLPDIVEVEFQRFNSGTWGGTHLHWKFKNRIAINSILSLQEIPIVLVHELIHLSQLQSGMLRVDRSGKVYWQGRQYEINGLSYSDYQMLPWELDVSHRLKKILELALKP